MVDEPERTGYRAVCEECGAITDPELTTAERAWYDAGHHRAIENLGHRTKVQEVAILDESERP